MTCGRALWPIGACEVLIAGQALARDRTLITRILRAFERVTGLSARNWKD